MFINSFSQKIVIEGLDKGFWFAKIEVVNLTAFSVRRDGGFIFYE